MHTYISMDKQVCTLASQQIHRLVSSRLFGHVSLNLAKRSTSLPALLPLPPHITIHGQTGSLGTIPSKLLSDSDSDSAFPARPFQPSAATGSAYTRPPGLVPRVFFFSPSKGLRRFCSGSEGKLLPATIGFRGRRAVPRKVGSRHIYSTCFVFQSCSICPSALLLNLNPSYERMHAFYYYRRRDPF